jgi:Fibronectin type III domain
MSDWTSSRVCRVAAPWASAFVLVATLATTAPAAATSPASSSSILAPRGEITPIALHRGTASGHQPVFAQPFRALDDSALRAAKLRAAAALSRGNRQPATPPRTALGSFFNNLNRPGLSQLTVAPPDSTGAVGPSNYVEMVNQQIGVYDRSLNLLVSSDIGAFMGAGSLTVTDPQVDWDAQGGHWLYAALGIASGANMLLFGWSKTADPSNLSNWCLFGTPRGHLLDDYPKLGHDDNYMTIGSNVYDDTNAPSYVFLTANVFAISKPQAGDASCSVGSVAYVADTAHPLRNADGSAAFTPVPANTADASSLGYVVAAHSPIDGSGAAAPKIMVWHWAKVAGAPAFIADGDVPVTTFDIPAQVPQAGTSYVIDTLDARLTQAVAVNDPAAGSAKGIWTEHTVAGPGGRSIVRWYEILGGSPATLRQQGDIGSPTDFVWNGAVSPSIGGDSAAVVYNRGGGSVLPVIATQTRTSSTTLGNMEAGELVIAQSSATDLDFTCGYSTPTDPCRWGDYAGASPDPVNPGVVWGSGQITGPCYILCGFFAQWQTQNFAIVASTSSGPLPPGAPALNTPTAGNGSVNLSWAAPASDGGAPIADYGVYRSTTAGGETLLARSGGAVTYTDSAVTNGTTYYYKVAAINTAGTGAFSNEVSATPTAPAGPDFGIAVSPTSRQVTRGSSTTYAVTVTAANGFSGFVNFASTISPSATGVTMSFNPTGVTLGSSAQSTFTVVTTRRTAKRTYTITITGTSGTLVHATTVSLTVR